MTEKERMRRQLLYDANHDKTLRLEREAAKELCHRYNLLSPSDHEGQQALMRQLLGRTDGTFHIVAPFWCDYGYNISVGREFFANHNTVILDCAAVTFGDHVFIAPNCGFYTAGHPIDSERRNMGLEYARPITVGDNVWIGAGTQVMPGVTIGNNTVIGGGSVVTRDIPANCVAVGNPCRVIRTLSDVPPVISQDQLTRIRSMEQILTDATAAVETLSAALADYEAVLPRLKTLEAYYESALWMQDYDDDCAGKLPDDLRRGVLSQDAVYDLLAHDRRLREAMTRLAKATGRNTPADTGETSG